MTADDKYILVGKLGRSRGVNGDIWVTPSTDFLDRFLGLEMIWVSDSSGWVCRKIVASKLVGERPVLRFEGIKSKEQASRLTNCNLAVTAEQLVALPEGSYYEFQLIGCDVVDQATGEPIGELVEIQRYPANDVYTVKKPDGVDLMVPAVRDFIERIDIEERRVYVFRARLLDE